MKEQKRLELDKHLDKITVIRYMIAQYFKEESDSSIEKKLNDVLYYLDNAINTLGDVVCVRKIAPANIFDFKEVMYEKL